MTHAELQQAQSALRKMMATGAIKVAAPPPGVRGPSLRASDRDHELVEWRRMHGLSIRGAAKVLGLSEGYLCAIERKRRRRTFDLPDTPRKVRTPMKHWRD